MSEVQERPWGRWQILAEADNKVIKLLTVEPGHMLSLQTHAHRAESWQPLRDGLIVYKYRLYGNSVFAPLRDITVERMVSEKVYYIGRGEVHRLINPTAEAISVIETIVGKYDEDDITRIHDTYKRD